MRSPGCEELLLAPEERGRIDSQVKEKIANPRWYTRGIPGYWFTGNLEPCFNRTRPNTGLIYHNKILHVSVLKTLHYVYLPQQPVLGPYFLKEVSAFLSPKHCPPFCNANISRFFSRDT